MAFAEWNKRKINVIDTPGVGNFLSDSRAALLVADAALIVVDAVAGAMVQTEKVWAAAEELRLPRLVVVNRLDRDRASLDRALQSMREACSSQIVPIQLPIGTDRSFCGVIDLVTASAVRYSTDGSGTPVAIDLPPDQVDAVAAARDALVERIAESDEALLERFLENGTLTDAELSAGLRNAVAAGKVFPLVCTSGLLNIGVQPLLDAIVTLLPAPSERPFVGITRTGDAIARLADASLPAAAFVWKTLADPFAGRLTLFRVVSGVLRSDSSVCNKTRDTTERLGHLELLQGKTPSPVPEIRAGDLGAVAKLRDTRTNDVLGEKSDPILFHAIRFPEPVLSYAIEPKSRGDEDKISTAMHRLEEEDPTIRYARDEQTKELLLSGQGQLHIEVTVAKLKRRFGVEVTLKPPHVPYRETIKTATEAHGRHKKQTGGHGQFGDCRIRLEPLPRGAGFEFVDDIFGGAIPRQFVPAVEKGIQDMRMRGYLAGYPVVDFKATVYDGSYHDVDSNELSFRMAGSIAFKDAMTRAHPTILEPIMNVEVHVPSDFAGDVMGDLNGRRGRISGMDTRGAATLIRAHVPMSEMLTYEQHLTSATGGRGSYHMEYAYYEEVPPHLQGRIIEAARTERVGPEPVQS